jgi:ribose-phosphate pyrophosphokinase
MGQFKLITSTGEVIDHRSFVFAGGEIQVRLNLYEISPEMIIIRADLRSAADVMELLLLTNALRKMFVGIKLSLEIPYLPYARQDRVCASGEAFALEVMCQLINLQRFETVTVWDVHSQKSLELLERSINIEAVDLIPPALIKGFTLVAPDKGAVARTRAVADRYNIPMILAEKVRNPETMEITGTKIHNEGVDCSGDLLIIDDICDGGRTFIELAKVLRPITQGKICLWVTHMIGSQGFDVFEGLIDEIYTANCFKETVPSFVHIAQN